MTIEQCISYCVGFKYAGLQNGFIFVDICEDLMRIVINEYYKKKNSYQIKNKKW
jgi:hypothetical protein